MSESDKDFFKFNVCDSDQVNYKDLYFSIDRADGKDRVNMVNFNHGLVNKNNFCYLRLDSTRKIILRFLLEKGLSKAELAKILNITVKNLDKIFAKNPPLGLLAKINLPLVTLYCSTKWS